MTEGSLTRRERNRLRNRREILDAARELVAGKGVDGVTIEDIARATDFAVGSIYRHFRSKEELLELMLCDLAMPFLDEVEQLAVAPGPFAERFDRTIEAFALMAAEHEPLWQLFLVAPGGLPLPGTEPSDHLKATSRRYFEAVRRLIVDGQASGFLADGDPGALAQLLIGMLGTCSRASALGRVELALGLATTRRVFLDGARR